MRATTPGESRTKAEFVLDVLPACMGGRRADAGQYLAAVLGTAEELVAGEERDLPVGVPTPRVVLERPGEGADERAAGVIELGAAYAQVEPDFAVAGDRHDRAHARARIEPGPARHFAVRADAKRCRDLKFGRHRHGGGSDNADRVGDLPKEQR